MVARKVGTLSKISVESVLALVTGVAIVRSVCYRWLSNSPHNSRSCNRDRLQEPLVLAVVELRQHQR